MLSRFVRLTVLSVFVGLAGCGSAWAADPTLASNAKAIDTVWMLMSAFLVFFMQVGFAMLECGFTRAKNAANVCMKGLLDFSVGSIVFWLVGFGIMFGTDAYGLFGKDGWMLSVGDPSTGEGLWQIAFWMFQVAFAAAAATIISGAVAERTRFSSYLFYTVFITGLIYPVVGHWVWGGGWLSNAGFLDFAGSTVVHSVGGWSALAGALMVGPRLGKYNADGTSNAIPGHSLPLATLGVFILWFGWYGFNAGSTTSGTNLSIATIAVTTTLAAGAGAIGALLTVWLKFGKPEASMTLNGALAGLVSITAPCAMVSPLSAVMIGLVGGVLVVFSVEFIDKVLHIDDPVGASSVHGACGVWGTLAVGFFAEAAYGTSSGTGAVNGLFFGGGVSQLLIQLKGAVAVFGWAFVASLIVFWLAKKLTGLRASDQEQIDGLDLGEHDLASYPDFQHTTIKSYHLRER